MLDSGLLIQGSGIRTGIMGIERNIEKKQRETGKEVSQVRLMGWGRGGGGLV